MYRQSSALSITLFNSIYDSDRKKLCLRCALGVTTVDALQRISERVVVLGVPAEDVSGKLPVRIEKVMVTIAPIRDLPRSRMLRRSLQVFGLLTR